MGLAQFARGRETETVVAKSVGKGEQHEGTRRPLRTLLVNRYEFGSGLQCLQHLIVLNGNALPALIPPAFQNQPSAASLHALPESVRLGAPTIIWLVRPLWHLLSSFQNLKSSTPSV